MSAPRTTPVTPRPAATVMMVRDASAAGGAPLEVFLQKRQSSMAFGGAYVFPGGAVDAADRESTVDTAGLDDAEANGRLDVPVDGRAYYLAAIRESFEEVGVLFASGGAGDATDELRARVDTGELTLAALVDQLGCELQPERLSYVGNFVTPDTEPVRFDARFFVAELPPGQQPVGVHAEIVESEWISPADAMARFDSGDMFLIGPTIHSLVFLTAFEDLAQLMTFVEDRQVKPVPVVDGAWGKYLAEPEAVAADGAAVGKSAMALGSVAESVTTAHGGAA